MKTKLVAKTVAKKYFVLCYARVKVKGSFYVQMEITIDEPLQGATLTKIREMVAETSGLDNPDDVVILNIIPLNAENPSDVEPEGHNAEEVGFC